MAYKQTPGRGNSPKTGSGLPSVLNSGSTDSSDPRPKGNVKGYETKTSSMETGPYEKKLDTVGAGSFRSVRMISGKGDVMGEERLGTSGAAKLKKTFDREKAYTDERRTYNREFLESREATGKAANESMKKSGLLKK
jgi:hypothetical protein